MPGVITIQHLRYSNCSVVLCLLIEAYRTSKGAVIMLIKFRVP